MFDEKIDEYDDEFNTDWLIKCFERVSLNGTIFHTYTTGMRRVQKKYVILVRWENEHGERKSSFAIIRKIMLLEPFPLVETVLNGVYLRLSFYNEIEKLGDGITICTIDEYSSEVYPLHVCYPTNFIVVPLVEDGRFAIIDVEKQFQ